MSYFDKVCQQWQCEADGNLAQNYQHDEYKDKKLFNINTRRTVREDIHVAKRVHESLKNGSDNNDYSDLCEEERSKLKDVVYIQREPEVCDLSHLDSGAYSTVELKNIFRKSRYHNSDEDEDDDDDLYQHGFGDSIEIMNEPLYEKRLPEPIRRVEDVNHVQTPSKSSKRNEYDFESLQRLIRGATAAEDFSPRFSHARDSILARELQDEELAKLLQAEEDRKAQQRQLVKDDEAVAKSFDETDQDDEKTTAKKTVSFDDQESLQGSTSQTSSAPNRVRKTKRTCILVYKGMSGEDAIAKYLHDVGRKNSTSTTPTPVEYTKVTVHEVAPPGGKPQDHEATRSGSSRTIFYGKDINGSIGSSDENGNNEAREKAPPQRPPLPPKLSVKPKKSGSIDGVAKDGVVRSGSSLWYSGYADEGNYSGNKAVSVNKPF